MPWRVGYYLWHFGSRLHLSLEYGCNDTMYYRSTAGTYSVTVTTPGGGCTSTCSKTITVNSGGIICNISGCDNNSICTGESVTICATSGVGYTYRWSTGATTQCITVSSAGTYSVTVTTASGGCTSTCSKTITVNGGGIICNISGCNSNSICSGQPVTICATSGVGYTYRWNTGATTECITLSNPGTYSVTVTNASGCTSVCSKTITVNGNIVCNISGCNSNTICAGQSVSLCATSGAGYTYEWTTGENTQCITVNSAGMYCVTITNASGCTSYCSRTITMNGAINCSISGCSSNTICSGQSVTLCTISGAGYHYEWTTGENTQCISINSPGTYCVTVTNASGCSSVCSRTITMNSEIACSITGSNTICTGQSVSLCTISGAGYRYEWTTGENTRCITVTTAGTYCVTVTNASGCSSVCSKIITLVPPPTCTISGNLILNTGQSTQLCAPLSNAAYLWSTGATTSCISTNAIGTYSVTVTNASGCSSSCSVRVIPMSGFKNPIIPNVVNGHTRAFVGNAEAQVISNSFDKSTTILSVGNIEAQAFPNPFTNSTTIQFRSHNSTENVTVEVFNTNGVKVVTLFNGKLEAEELQSANFDAAYLTAGMYFYRITSGETRLNGKIVLIKR